MSTYIVSAQGQGEGQLWLSLDQTVGIEVTW